MIITLRHQLQDDERVLVTVGGAVPVSIHVQASEAKRFAWGLLADLDPDQYEELGPRPEVERDNRVARLQRAFKLTPTAAGLLLALYDASGALVSFGALDLAMGSGRKRDEDRRTESVRVIASTVRRALGKRSVMSVWGRGYRLSEEAAARIKAVLPPACLGDAA